MTGVLDDIKSMWGGFTWIGKILIFPIISSLLLFFALCAIILVLLDDIIWPYIKRITRKVFIKNKEV